MTEGTLTRRDFLRGAAGAAAVAATGAACRSGSDKPNRDRAAAADSAPPKGRRSLRIVQWGHFIPAYDIWFDGEYTQRWGEEHGVQVVVDHLPFAQIRNRADAEVAAQHGHDIFGFNTPPAAFEDEVIDHRAIIQEVEAKVGKLAPLVERSVLNPRTGRYFGVPDWWTPNLVNYRVDLWDRVEPGLRPSSWDNIQRAGSKLKAMGHSLGIGIAPDIDVATSLPALMHAYGSSIQDADGGLTINSPATIEAVKVGTAIFRSGMTNDVLAWDGASDNRHLTSGQGSLILDPVSALRGVEKQDPELARQIHLAPLPAGPGGAFGPYALMSTYVIWRFSPNRDLAGQFLVDLALEYREAFLHSEFYNQPGFPGAVPDLKDLVANDARAQPPEKYRLLADAAEWSTNLGHPGHTSAPIDEILNQYLVPQMFAAAARGELTPEEAVKGAETQMKPIFEKWRERGKI